jgi:allophanate hydrolase
MSVFSARAIAAQVVSRKASAAELACEALERLQRYDEIQPQAWIRRCTKDEILTHARQVDERVAAGEHLALAGVPFAVKDNIDVAGLETTAACPAFAYVARKSSPLVQRLTEAGAVLIGKTNLDQFATGLSGTRSPHGAPRCVFNREYVSGGSSSGSAVVVAAGIVPLALGTDTAGSGRVPAAFNHLVGFKPTRGRWSTRGLVPACRSLDCVTTFTHEAADARYVDEVLAGFDPHDPYSRHRPIKALDKPSAALRTTRVGVPGLGQLQFLGDAESEALFAQALARLSRLGCTPVEIDIAPFLEAGHLLYSGPWVAERTAALETLLRREPSAIHPTVRAIVQAGAGISAVEAFRGLYRLKELRRATESIWEQVDALLLPTTPTIYRVDELLAEPVALNSNLGLYTNFVNLLDLCAVAIPAGFRRNATGFGVSLMGPAWSDEALLDLAECSDQERAREEIPALDATARPATVRLAVVGAHLSGMPLNWQLASRSARLIERTRTAPVYRLYAMRGQSPPKPALVHVGEGGRCIELELYELEQAAFGSFVAEVPPPLAIGTVVLENGIAVRGFVAESRAVEGAEDISAYLSWRAYCAGKERTTSKVAGVTC